LQHYGCCVRCLVVVPTYNEVENVDEVLERTRAALPDGEVLVVDDGSPDGTADRAEEVGRRLGGRIHVLRRTEKAGLGAAYRAGFGWGVERGFEALVEMDADLSHDPAALPSLLAEIERGADLVIGSRYVPGGSIPAWAWHRRALSKWGNRYAAWVLGLDVRDATGGYRAYHRNSITLLDASAFRARGYGFQIETAYRVARAGGRIVEVPIAFADRTRGTSKMNSRIVFEALLLVTGWGIRDRVLRRSGTRGRRARDGQTDASGVR
jgi:dolichol-phosphate mannosyltransferase